MKETGFATPFTSRAYLRRKFFNNRNRACTIYLSPGKEQESKWQFARLQVATSLSGATPTIRNINKPALLFLQDMLLRSADFVCPITPSAAQHTSKAHIFYK